MSKEVKEYYGKRDENGIKINQQSQISPGILQYNMEDKKGIKYIVTDYSDAAKLKIIETTIYSEEDYDIPEDSEIGMLLTNHLEHVTDLYDKGYNNN